MPAVPPRLPAARRTLPSLMLAGLMLAGLALASVRPAAAAPADTPPADSGPLMVATLPLVEQLPIQAVRVPAGTRLVLDGTLSHPAWATAPVYNRFVTKDPVNGGVPRYETRVQVLFDDQALWVGVTALDDHPEEIRGPLVRHDAVNRTQDFIQVALDPIGKRQSAQLFRVNAGGSTGDGMHTSADDNEDFSPDFDFDAASHIDSLGWTAVFRIPFASLRYTGKAEAGWRILVMRRVPREDHLLWTSVPIPLDTPSFIATMQPLQGVGVPADAQFLTVRPTLTVHRSSSTDPGQPTKDKSGLEASLDIKWRPRPELVVDGTVKPDFSQVALDVPQLSGNSSFALYLPEKRPFFFESSDLLRSPSQALYTRSFTQPQWGTRATWRGDRWSGAAFLIDDRGGGSTLLPYAYGTDSVTQPRSKAAAARLRADVPEVDGLFRGLELGSVMSLRRYEAGQGDNAVAGPDLDWQLNDRWHLRGQWLHSSTTAQPDGLGGLARAAAREGNYLQGNLSRSGENSSLDFNYNGASAGFRHDSGFYNQVDMHSFDLHQGYGWRQLGPLNELWVNLNEGRTTVASTGEIAGQYLQPGVWIGAAHGVGIDLSAHLLSEVRTAAGHALLHERYAHLYAEANVARWLPHVQGSLNLGRLADYSADRVRPGGRLELSASSRPFGAFEFEPSLWTAWLKGADGRVTYRDTAGQLLGVWHLDARQNLRVIVQRSSYDRKAEPALGVSAGRDSGGTTSLTYAWRRSMGTVLYVGATRGRSGNPDVTRGNEVFVKLQVDADEVRKLF